MTWLRRMIALGVALSAPALLAATLPAVEPMPTLDAATLAPPELLNGQGYTVDAKAPVVGYMGQFTLRAPAGTFSADGTEMLAIRIDELTAIAKLSQMSETGAFADALAESAKKTGAAIGKAVTNPVETISGLPAGVGRMFQSTTTTVSRATQPKGTNSASTTESAMDLLGVNKAKRQIAMKVGADPYTTNPVLAKQLDDLAQAAFAGGVSLDAAMAVSTAGVATAISATATVSNLVWDSSPDDIRTIHEKKLAAMGVGAQTIRAFVTNRWFTPTLSIPFVENLVQMPSVKGRPAIVALASTVASEAEARFIVNAVDMARQAGTATDPVISLGLAGRILIARTKGGRVEVPAPVDYVVWTEPVKAFAQRKDLTGVQRTILVTGLASSQAASALEASGWTVKERAKR